MTTLMIMRHSQIYQDLVDDRDVALYITEMTATSFEPHWCSWEKSDDVMSQHYSLL